MRNLIGQLSAGVRDMEMAATLDYDRRRALEAHATERFWTTIDAMSADATDKAGIGARTSPSSGRAGCEDMG